VDSKKLYTLILDKTFAPTFNFVVHLIQ